jgi:alkaline phosphatase D
MARAGTMGAVARVVQISDTHVSAAVGVPPEWPALVRWLTDDPPDLVVHSGDIVLVDPDDDADREFATGLMGALPCPWVVIPGNHDVGFYGEEAELPRRLQAFTASWGGDRFVLDLDGWRVVGANAYLLGTADHDGWLAASVDVDGPVAVFVHQPVGGDPVDGWEMPPGPRAAFAEAIAGADVRVLASGHRHAFTVAGRAVWAPSLTLDNPDPTPGTDPRRGLVEHVLEPDGRHRWRVVHV